MKLTCFVIRVWLDFPLLGPMKAMAYVEPNMASSRHIHKCALQHCDALMVMF